MSNYNIIAFDMDGTLLNSQKTITPATLAAIERAFRAGKEVVLSTGRCLPELYATLEAIPRLRYLICVSGAMVYDWKEKRLLHASLLPVETVQEILRLTRPEAPMLHLLTTESIVQRDQESHMADYGMGIYQSMFDEVATLTEDLSDWYLSHPAPLAKLNLYHTSPESRARSRALLAHLPIEMADAETTSLECSARGVTKGTGLLALCEALQVPLEQVIAVGDADNDIDVLRRAGLSVAMGNANPRVKELCQVSVSDCDHDGCAEAIERWLL